MGRPLGRGASARVLRRREDGAGWALA